MGPAWRTTRTRGPSRGRSDEHAKGTSVARKQAIGITPGRCSSDKPLLRSHDRTVRDNHCLCAKCPRDDDAMLAQENRGRTFSSGARTREQEQWSVPLLFDDELDAPVFGKAVGILALDQGAVGPEPFGADALGFDTSLDEVIAHRVRAPLAELDVAIARAGFIRVALDAHALDLLVGLHRESHLIQNRIGLGFNLRRSSLEVDLLENPDLALLHDDLRRAFVGAAVIILEAVDRLLLVGALVLGIRNSITVLVVFGAAVIIVHAVAILGLIHAPVTIIRHAVVVRVVGGRRISNTREESKRQYAITCENSDARPAFDFPFLF